MTKCITENKTKVLRFIMPPTLKRLVGHIAFGAWVAGWVRASHFYVPIVTFNPSLAFCGFCRASEYPQPLLVAANAGVYIASIWEGNPAHDNGSVNPRLYNVYHMALKCAFQKFLVIV